MVMKMAELQKIKKREDAATKEPWHATYQGINGSDICWLDITLAHGLLSHADAEFIAHMREDGPAMRKALMEAYGALAEMLEAHSSDPHEMVGCDKNGCPLNARGAAALIGLAALPDDWEDV